MFCGFISIKGKKEKRVKKSPRCVMHRGPCYVESEFKNIFFLHATAGNSERSSDSCKEGYCNLQNCFPSIYFHIFNFLMLSVKC